jgi:hypothetical protein
MVEWVIGIGFIKQVNDTVDHGVRVVDRFPFVSQNIQTHFPLSVDIWVIDLHEMRE